MNKNFLVHLSLLASLLASPLALADNSPVVEHDGRYIYYRTSWTHLSQADQVSIIDASVQLLKTEISTVSAKEPGLETLSNTLLSSKELDTLTTEAQQSVTILDNENERQLLPAGLLVYGGGSIDAGFVVNVKGSTDIGLVIVPTAVTRVDTETNETSNYFELDWNFVAVPHLYAGLGVGGGGSGSVGVGMIWGDLNKASDFGGIVGSVSADVQLLAGADMEASTVRNMSLGKTFALGTVEFDWGPEAAASADGEAGYVLSLGSQGVTQVPKTAASTDDSKAAPAQPAK